MVNFETCGVREDWHDLIIRHLTFIQDVITRMNRNAFQLKGWCVTIVSALAALSVKTDLGVLLIVAAISSVLFGFLDGYYLLMERQFRGLYNDAIDKNIKIDGFSLNVAKYRPENFSDKKSKRKYSYLNVLISGSVGGFYFPVFLICVIGAILMLVASSSVKNTESSIQRGVVLEKTVSTNFNYRILEVYSGKGSEWLGRN